MHTCPFYPPAPSPGPSTIIDYNPAEFCLQAKANGARCLVLWSGGHRVIFNRHGTELTAPKGHATVLAITSDLPVGVALDAEYIHAERQLYIFDLPLHPGILDERLADIPALLPRLPGATMIPMAHGDFARHAADWRAAGAEGFILKKRSSLYRKCARPNTKVREWVKFRFSWQQ